MSPLDEITWFQSSHGVSAWRLYESVAITETTRSAACNFQGQKTPIAAFINQMEPRRTRYRKCGRIDDPKEMGKR